MHDHIYTELDSVRYSITCTVDEEALQVYDISIWYHVPLPGVSPLLRSFTPNEAKTPLELSALEAVETAYGICPVLEKMH